MAKQSEERACVLALFEKLEAQPRLAIPQPRESIAAPQTHGIYVIRDANGTAVHVGRTVSGQKGLAQRVLNQVRGISSFVRGYLNGDPRVLRNGLTFQYIEVPNDRERALLEHHAIAWHCPAHLGLGRKGGNE